VASITGFLNISLSLLFVTKLNFGIWSLALSYSITSIIDSVILFVLLSKKLGGFDKKSVTKPFFKISVSTILMGVTLYVPMKLLDNYLLDTSRTINLLALTFIAGICGTSTYILFTKIFNVYEVNLLYRLLAKIRPEKEAVKPQNLSYEPDQI
jgi:putative peptidoglycan lipid II flippase